MTNLLARIYDAANDVVTSDVDNTNTTTDTLEAAKVNNTIHFAEDDADLDQVLTEVSDGDTVYLSPANFSDDRTIDTIIRFIGASATTDSGFGQSKVSGDWTIGSEFRGCYFETVRIDGNWTVEAGKSKFHACSLIGSITVNQDDVILSMIEGGGTITFGSSTSKNIVDSSTGVTVIDNGNNTVGDIA